MKLGNEFDFETLDSAVLQKSGVEEVFKIGSKSFVVSEELSRQPDLLASFNSKHFLNLLQSKVAEGFTGEIMVDTGYGKKTLYLKAGQLVFAASDAIDDRLGEILYRRGVINLDQLTDAAVQVTPETKFGQVLVNENILTSTDVWEVLKQQVVHILRTTLMPDRTMVTVIEGPFKLFAEVFFVDGTRDLVEKANVVATQSRIFKNALSANSSIRINEDKLRIDSLNEGTFARDFFELISENNILDDIIEASKLSPYNTIATLYETFQREYVLVDIDLVEEKRSRVDLTPLRKAVSDYRYLIHEVRSLFEEANVSLPFPEIKRFAEKVGVNLNQNFHIEDDLDISKRTVESLKVISLAKDNCQDVVATFDCMMQFVRLLAADHLSGEYYSRIREISFEEQTIAS